jgi:hypothetical protein
VAPPDGGEAMEEEGEEEGGALAHGIKNMHLYDLPSSIRISHIHINDYII